MPGCGSLPRDLTRLPKAEFFYALTHDPPTANSLSVFTQFEHSFVRTKLVEPFKTFYTPVGNVRIRGIRALADSAGTQSVEAWIMAEVTEYLVMHQLASSLDGAGTV